MPVCKLIIVVCISCVHLVLVYILLCIRVISQPILIHLVEIICIRLVVILVLKLVVVVIHEDLVLYDVIVSHSRRDVKCYLVEIS